LEEFNEFSQIIIKIESGEKQAYEELYEKTIQDVYKNVHFLIEDKADIDDLVQEVYIQLFRSLKNFNVERHFKPWLMGIVFKQVQSYRRKRWMRFRISKKVEEINEIKESDYTKETIEKLVNNQLVKLVDELPYKLKQVIILRYLNDYSQEEISRILHIPLGTVKSRINAGITKLREKGKNRKIFEEVRNVYEF
jgi:RNA polymerase sigma-70 factor (ECF subfamily)